MMTSGVRISTEDGMTSMNVAHATTTADGRITVGREVRQLQSAQGVPSGRAYCLLLMESFGTRVICLAIPNPNQKKFPY